MRLPRLAAHDRLAAPVVILYWLVLFSGLGLYTLTRPDHASTIPLWIGTIAGTCVGHYLALRDMRSWIALLVIAGLVYWGAMFTPRAYHPAQVCMAFAPAALCAFWSLGERAALAAFWFPAVVWMLSILERTRGASSTAPMAIDGTGAILLGVLAIGFVAFLRARETRRVGLWTTIAPVRLATAKSTAMLREPAGRQVARAGWSLLVSGFAFAVTAWVAPQLWHVESLGSETMEVAKRERALGLPCCPVQNDELDIERARVREYLDLGRGKDRDAELRPGVDCQVCPVTDEPDDGDGGGGAFYYSPGGEYPGGYYYGFGGQAHGTAGAVAAGEGGDGGPAHGAPGEPTKGPGAPGETTAPALSHEGGPTTAPMPSAPPQNPTPREGGAPQPVPQVPPTAEPLPPENPPAPVEEPPVSPPETARPPEDPQPRSPVDHMSTDPLPPGSPAPHARVSRGPAPANRAPPRAPPNDLARTVLGWVILLVGVALSWRVFALALRPIRRLVTLRHLRKPFWDETVDQRVSNAWQLALVGLRDVGWRATSTEAPREFARRANVDGIDRCAAILERARHGLGLDPQDLAEILSSAETAYRSARTRVGLFHRAIAWLRWPLT